MSMLLKGLEEEVYGGTTAGDPALCLDMDFRPGDVQLLKNSTILHSRTAYEDWEEAPRKRHLLRFWVSARAGFSGSDQRLKAGIPRKRGVASDSAGVRGDRKGAAPRPPRP